MNVREAIVNRQTIRKFTDKINDKKVIDVLEDAVYAPNHGQREPWRFILINDNESYQKLITTYKNHNLSIPYMENCIKENNFPTMLVVVMEKNSVEKKYLEDYLAHGALIQNIQLLAWEQNIGVVWKTNFLKQDIYKDYGIGDNEMVTGFLLMGSYDDKELKSDRTRKELVIE